MPRGIYDQPFGWTEKRIELLRKRWGQGATASQIALELGNVTRNAVVGKAHRLGLLGRPSPIKVLEPGQAKAPRKYGQRPIGNIAAEDDPKQPAPPIVASPPPAAYLPPPRTSSRDACAWPIGDTREPGFHFCGATPVVIGKPYCAEHCRRAYRTPDQAAKERAAEQAEREAA